MQSPFDGDGNETAWLVVDADARRAIVGSYRVLNRPVPGPVRLRLRGLDRGATYRVTEWPEEATPLLRGGDELMAHGLVLDETRDEAGARGDFTARLFVLEAVEGSGRPQVGV